MDTQEKQDKIVEIATKWGKIGLLDGLSREEQDRVAVLLENQRLWNENEEGGDAQWRRIAFLLYIVFSGLRFRRRLFQYNRSFDVAVFVPP